MKHEKIFLILCSVILIFCIANAYASDVNDTITSSDNGTELIEQTDDVALASSDGENALQSSMMVLSHHYRKLLIPPPKIQ